MSNGAIMRKYTIITEGTVHGLEAKVDELFNSHQIEFVGGVNSQGLPNGAVLWSQAVVNFGERNRNGNIYPTPVTP